MSVLYSNESTKALIKSLITKGREPHSIAICGDKGQGKKAMARYIGSALLCEENSGEPCGKCKSCRMIEKGVHPDFITIKPNDNGNYQVDVIRSMVSDAITKPNEGRYKVYLISDLDRSINTAIQVQNILLKLTEEPPEHCIIILTAISKEIFLETVISRVLFLNVMPCRVEDSENYLKAIGKYSGDEIKKAISFGAGNIGRCIDYLEDPIYSEALDISGNAMEAICKSDEYGLLKALFEADGKKLLFRHVLLIFEEAFRDACVLRAGGHLSHGMLYEKSLKASGIFSEIQCIKRYDIISSAVAKLDANANQTLTMNDLTARLFDKLM